ncbi:MAG: TIR domain-containing protein [Giesbergeria sp.]|uniref:TIR domain-containing protein n=1 Tax=Giesbergeria sp. TaxID=2818473 RepID=UPI002602ABE3|nr:TIR domain-containing protein [Giesbergeria sp.]MDD2609369.1 TIR domain-containing protein [Giesbergeria sp.]
MTNTYNLFISHSWAYSDAYEKLIGLLDSKGGCFPYKNYSVPQDDPIHNAPNQAALRAAIERQIKPASVVLILAGVYATYSKWINVEIEIAAQLGKPIIAIEPWGSEKTSKVVKDAADKIVKWQTDSIVNAIREVA